jgi:hypothetical protein
MIFCREEQSYTCSYSAVSIGNSIFSIGVMELQKEFMVEDLYFQVKTTKMVPLLFTFSNICFCDLRSRFG